MAKYFSGITLVGNKYSICIIDDNLNVIFMDNLEIDKLVDLLKRKSVTTVSVDFPCSLYLKHSNLLDNKDFDKFTIKKRALDNLLSMNNLYTYQDKFILNKNSFSQLLELILQLNKLGFSIKQQGEKDKSIIESYPSTSFIALGCSGGSSSEEESVRKKFDTLKNKGMRIKDFFNKNRKDYGVEINILCQAYTSYLYYSDEATCLGTAQEGILVIPGKDSLNKQKGGKELRKANTPETKPVDNKPLRTREKHDTPVNIVSKPKMNTKVIAEYCGAQYLYTNTDGIIRINDLRPIKSYRPFTEIYEIKHIKQVQVIIGTTDGLRKVKANLIPNTENSTSFRAAEEEDKKKLDSFWGNNGDKRGYLIKFNKVEVIKA